MEIKTPRFNFSYVIIPIFLVIGMILACEPENQFVTEDTQSPAVFSPTAIPAVTPTPAPTAVPAPTVTPVLPETVSTLGCPTNQRVELSVLVEPLDSGNVEIAGSEILTNGGATPVCKDDQINITARPNPDYRLDRWEDDATGNRSSIVIVMTSSKKVRVVFIKADVEAAPKVEFYQLQLNSDAVGNGSIAQENGIVDVRPAPGPGSSPYPEGTEVLLTAKPDTGYQLGEWSGDCVGNRPCVVVMDRDRNVAISFTIQLFSLTTRVEPAGGGSISPTGTTIHEYGSPVIPVFETTSGYTFSGWTGACSGTGSCGIIMVADKSVTADFTPQIRLSVVRTGSGAVVSSPAGIDCGESCDWPFDQDSVVTITATAGPDSVFDGWSGASCSGTDSCTVSMTTRQSITASFTEQAYTLTSTANPVDGGNVSGGGSYSSGSLVTLTASPSAGWIFSGWSGDCSGTGECSVSINSDKKVFANFSKQAFSLNANASPSNGGRVDVGNVFTAPGLLTVTASPNSGWSFVGWAGECSGAGTCSLILDADKSVTAFFVESASGFALTTSVSPSNGGTIFPVGANNYSQGSLVTVTAAPASGFTFNGWSGACSGSGPCSVSMDSPKSVTANFAATPTQQLPQIPAPTPPPTQITAESDIPGTLLALGATVSSVVDVNAKLWDIYALNLTAGQEVQFRVDGVGGSSDYVYPILANPGSGSFATNSITEAFSANTRYNDPWSRNFAPAVSGTYYLGIKARSAGNAYTLSVTATS